MHRRFRLKRTEDVSGVSGTGYVAEGVVFSDGHAAMRWTAGEHHTTVAFDSIDDVTAIHGHNGASEVEWVDIELETSD